MLSSTHRAEAASAWAEPVSVCCLRLVHQATAEPGSGYFSRALVGVHPKEEGRDRYTTKQIKVIRYLLCESP